MYAVSSGEETSGLVAYRTEIIRGQIGYIWIENKEGLGKERREKMNWLWSDTESWLCV